MRVTVSVRRVPRLLLVPVLALAPYEARPLLSAAQLLRGMAIRMPYRWGNRHLLAEDADRAVLLWSVRGRGGRPDLRGECRGVVAAVASGSALFLASNALLLLPLTAALTALGVPSARLCDLAIALVCARLAVTLWRAVCAYRHEVLLDGRLPTQQGVRWSVDLLAAWPAGAGHGRDLLQRFLAQADEADAEVVLHCDRRNGAFYGHHGFGAVADGGPDTQLLLLRPSASSRRAQARDRARQQLRGRLRRSPARSAAVRPVDRLPV